MRLTFLPGVSRVLLLVVFVSGLLAAFGAGEVFSAQLAPRDLTLPRADGGEDDGAGPVTCIAEADFDEDGIRDVVVARSGGVGGWIAVKG